MTTSGQVVKTYKRRRVVKVVRRLVQGTEEALTQLLQASAGGRALNTAYIEQLNATFRSRLASLVRRTRYGVRRQRMLHLGMYLVGTVYNFCTHHDILTQAQGQPCTPAMAAASPTTFGRRPNCCPSMCHHHVSSRPESEDGLLKRCKGSSNNGQPDHGFAVTYHTALQAGDFQTQEGPNTQTHVIPLGNGHMELAPFNTGELFIETIGR